MRGAREENPVRATTRASILLRCPVVPILLLLTLVLQGCIRDGDDLVPDDDDDSGGGQPDDDDTGCVDDDLIDDDVTGDDDDDSGDDDSADDDSADDDTGDDDTGPPICPSGMVVVAGQFCMDIWEASRPDATDQSFGVDTSMAASQPGVKPWPIGSNQEAETACDNAGKRLCTPDEWFTACIGPALTDYPYGNTYEPETCNGIDTYCTCPDGSHYAGCYDDCGADFHLTLTGELPGCTNGYGVFDISGNLWEHTAGGDDTTVRGGAYNCAHSDDWHRCDYVPGWTPSALGFRCCADL